MAETVRLNQTLPGYVLVEAYKNKPCYLCLVDPVGANLTVSDTKAIWVARENTTDGITRKLFQWTVDGSYDPSDGRWEMPTIDVIESATTTAVEFYQWFALVDGSANRPVSFASTAIDVGTNRVTIASHGLSNGEPFVLVPGAGGTLPAPLASDAQPYLYYALSVTTNDFQVSRDGIATVDLTTQGSGDIWLKYAKGQVERLCTYDELQTLNPGQSITYQISLTNRDVTP